MVVGIRLNASYQKTSEGVIAQNFAIRAHGLQQYLFAVSYKQQPWPPAFDGTEPTIIEGCNYRLSGSGCSHYETASTPVVTLYLKSVKHVLLVRFRLQIEERLAHKEVTTGLTTQGLPKRAAVTLIARVIDLKFVVFPKRFEMRLRAPEKIGLPPLGELNGPLQTTHQRGT